MRFCSGAILLTLLLGVWPERSAADGHGPIDTVIELYTSQGCSSCPPADVIVKQYAQSSNALILTLPVDYWDYIGWRDTLASPRNTARQRAYAASLGFNQVYTPQAVVNGAAHAVGSDALALETAISRTKPVFQKRRVPIRFKSDGEIMTIETGEAPSGETIGQSTIWLALFRKTAEVAIKKGENAGRTLTYTNVVREMTPVGVWDGRPGKVTIANPALIQLDTEDAAVILQEGDMGPLTGAAWLER